MRISLCPLLLLSCVALLIGCESGVSSGGFGSGSGSGFGYARMPRTPAIGIGHGKFAVAPVEVGSSATSGYLISKIGSDYASGTLPRDNGFETLGAGAWVNFVVFDRTTGQSELAFNTRMVVWQAVRALNVTDSLLLLASEADTNGDTKVNDLDGSAVFHFNLADRKLTRLTPAYTTVIAAGPDRPTGTMTRDGKSAADAITDGLFVFLRVDRNQDGKWDQNEPPMVIRIDPAMKTSPQTVLSDAQWDKALGIWQER